MDVILKTSILKNQKYNLTYEVGVPLCLRLSLRIQAIFFLCHFSILKDDESLQTKKIQTLTSLVDEVMSVIHLHHQVLSWPVLLNFSSENQGPSGWHSWLNVRLLALAHGIESHTGLHSGESA